MRRSCRRRTIRSTTRSSRLERGASPGILETEPKVVQRGEERRPVASRDTRSKVDVAEDEVVVRAFGESASRVRL